MRCGWDDGETSKHNVRMFIVAKLWTDENFSEGGQLLDIFQGHYSWRLPDLDTACPCGETNLQTRDHVLYECPLHEIHRGLLGKNDDEQSLSALLGSASGITRLAKFIEASDAFKKT